MIVMLKPRLANRRVVSLTGSAVWILMTLTHASAQQEAGREASKERQDKASIDASRLVKLSEKQKLDGKTAYDAILQLGGLRREALSVGDEATARRIEEILLSRMRDSDDALAGAAGAALSSKEPRAERAVPVLLEILRRNGNSDRRTFDSLRFLRFFGKDAAAATPLLLSMVSDRTMKPEFRCAAITTLEATTADTQGLVAKLAPLAADEGNDFQVRCAAALTTARLDARIPQATMRSLLDATRKPAGQDLAGLRSVFVYALCRLAPEDETVDALAGIAEDQKEDLLVRETAFQALAKAKKNGHRAVPALVRIMTREQPFNQPFDWAVSTLASLGPSAGESKEFLTRVRNATKDARWREKLDEALKRISGHATDDR